MKPTNIPNRYDKARVARLKPVQAAVERLALPLNRKRKLFGILNALEMQIEDGGDSPDVNDRLLDALRASALHQVGRKKAKPLMDAIDIFARAENERWEQVRTGTLPPIEVSLSEQMDDLVYEAYEYLEKRQSVAACDRWLAAWAIAEQLITPEMRSAEDFKAAYPGGLYSFRDWCTELMFELHNAGLEDERYTEKRLAVARSFLDYFPDQDANTQMNAYRAQGEALWALGRRADAEAVYAEVVERFPDNAWGYIGWSDHYWLDRDAPGDYERAEAILRRALDRPTLNDRKYVLDRLESLAAKRAEAVQHEETAEEASPSQTPLSQRIQKTVSSLWEKPQKTAKANPPRPKRNDPCWCGSGKKYKHCHMKEDREKDKTR